MLAVFTAIFVMLVIVAVPGAILGLSLTIWSATRARRGLPWRHDVK